jgi:hypothetical protein
LDDIVLELYFDESVSYKEDISKIRDLCFILEKDSKASFRQIERQTLSSGTMKEVEDEIRGLNPQERGSIVTSHGFILPLSNSKTLNLRNTPVLLVKSEERLVYVFPCLLGDTYYNVLKGLDHLQNNLPALPSLTGLMEEAVIARVLNKLDVFEEGLIIQDREVETSAGRADLVLLDKQGRHLIIEVERQATDSALGQVLRLCAAYERKFGVSSEQVRAVVACIRIHEFVSEAANRAGIEIWQVPKIEDH